MKALSLYNWLLLVMVNELIVKVMSFSRRGLMLPPPEIQRVTTVDVDQQVYQQILDHYDPTNNKTFQQKYYQNLDNCKKRTSCPVFLYIGPEAPAHPVLMKYGSWVDHAKTFGAIMFLLEHRYYGESHPTQDLSVANLKYLSSQQALADIAYFIEGMSSKYKLNKKNKWILFGGSYAGSLAAWSRMKYPHLVHAAVSSSAPLKAQIDFKEYFQVVDKVLEDNNKDCSKSVHEAFLKLQNMLATDEGKKNINKLFNICDNYDRQSKDDVSMLLLSLATPFISCVQYDKIDCQAKNICQLMTNSSISDPLQRFVVLNKMSNEAGMECMNINFKDTVAAYSETSWDSPVSQGERQWLYQTCTEFGYYVTSTAKNDLFGPGIPLSSFLNQCTDIFGENFNEKNLQNDIVRTNMMYGSLDIQVTRVLYTHGSYDPWHALGITKSPYPQSPAIFIQGTSHCADLYSARSDDPPQLTAARRQTASLISKWLSQEGPGVISFSHLRPKI